MRRGRRFWGGRSRSISARRRTRKARSQTAAYLDKAIALARRFDFMLFADECYSEIYTEHAPPGALETAQAATGTVANVVLLPTRFPSARACPACVRGSSRAMRASSRHSSASATSPARRCRFLSSTSPSPPGLMRRMSEAGRALYRGQFRSSRTRCLRGRYGYRRPSRRFLPLARHGALTGVARRPRKPFGKGVVSECCRAVISPAGKQTGAIRAPTSSGSRSCMRPETTGDALTRIAPCLG